MKQHRLKYLNKLTLRTQQLEHQYSYEDIFILLKRMDMIDAVRGINITKKGYKFELTVTHHSTFYYLFQYGIIDSENRTTIKLKPLIPPIIINVTNVPLNAATCMVEAMILNETHHGFEYVYARERLVTFEGERFSTGRWEIHAWRYGSKDLPPLPTHSTYFCDRYVSLHYHTNDMHPTPTNHTFTPLDDSSDDEADNLPLPTRDEARTLDTRPTPQPPPQLQSTTIERQPSPETPIKPPKSPAKSTSTDRLSTPEIAIEPPKSPEKPTSIDRHAIPATTITPVTVPLSTNQVPQMDEVSNEIPPEIHKVVPTPHVHYEHIRSYTPTPIRIRRRWRDKR